MPDIHEIATLTSKGQITQPKSIRQVLGLDTSGKVAFDLCGGEVVVNLDEDVEICCSSMAGHALSRVRKSA